MFQAVSLIFTAALAIGMTSIVASAQCAQWGPQETWQLEQSNAVTVYIGDTYNASGARNVFTAKAYYGASKAQVRGQVEGTLQGSRLEMKIFWSNREVGVYIGKIDPRTGRVEGESYAKSSPNTRQSFFGLNNFRCESKELEGKSSDKAGFVWPGVRAANGEFLLLDYCLNWAAQCGAEAADAFCRSKGYVRHYSFVEANLVGRTALISNGRLCEGEQCKSFRAIACTKEAAPPPKYTGPTGPPVKTTGKVRGYDPVTRTALSAIPMTGVIPAGQMTGKTTVDWNVGPNYNYTELWVQIDDEKEKYIAQGLTGRQVVEVEPGRTYVFFLKTSKKRLTTATVKFSR